jgi:hypothetical protein
MGMARGAAAGDVSYVQIFADKSATGEALVGAFFDLLLTTGSPAGTVGTSAEQDAASRERVKPYLDPAFQLQRASGERYTAETYIPADVDEFEVGDVRETRPADDVVVVRYSVRATQTLPDAALVMSKDKAPRLTVFHWNEAASHWSILSHANFNTPIAAICDKTPIVESQLLPAASAEDQALGEKLIHDWFALAEKGSLLPMLSPMIQLQTAGGHGYTTVLEDKPGKFSKTETKAIAVTRNGKLMVVSLYARVSSTLLLGEEFGTTFAPRLYTWMDYGGGAWRLISSAYFNDPKKLPDGTVCVPAGELENAP